MLKLFIGEEMHFNNIKNKYLSKKYMYFYILTLFILFVTHYRAIHYDGLILDDLMRYKETINGFFSLDTIRFRRTKVMPFINYIFSKAMVFNLPMARYLITLFILFPLTLIFFYFCYNLLNIPFWFSIAISILVQIQTGLTHIPTFVTSNNAPDGILLFMLSFVMLNKYFEAKNIKLLISTMFIYIISIEMTEVTIFLLPIIPIFYYFKGLNKEKIKIIAVFFFFAIVKAIRTIMLPISSTTIKKIEILTIAKRFGTFLEWSTPQFPFIKYQYLGTITFILCTLIILLHHLFKFNKEKKKINLMLNYQIFQNFVFAFSWIFCAFFPFAFSNFFSNRYIYIAGFGVVIIYILAIQIILDKIKSKKITLVIILSLLVTQTLTRVQYNSKTFDKPERITKVIRKNISNINYPVNSQIVILGAAAHNLQTAGYWHWSTGYIEYLFERKDLTGLVGREFLKTNPFNPKERGFSYSMRGIDSSLPIYIYHIDMGWNVKRQFYQFSYATKWENNKAWSLFKLGKETGKMNLVAKGKNESTYQQKINELNLTDKDIAWD